MKFLHICSLNSPNGHTAHCYKISVLFSINKGRQELEPVSNKDHFVTQVPYPDPAVALEFRTKRSVNLCSVLYWCNRMCGILLNQI